MGAGGKVAEMASAMHRLKSGFCLKCLERNHFIFLSLFYLFWNICIDFTGQTSKCSEYSAQRYSEIKF